MIEKTPSADKKAGTRFGWISRYDNDKALNDARSSAEASDTTKNFPKEFIPMTELQDSRLEA